MQPNDFGFPLPETPLTTPAHSARLGLKIQAAGRSVVARVAGPFDQETAARLSTEIAASSRSSRRVVLDLSQASYIDSPGIRALLQLHSDLLASRRELRLAVRRGSSVERTFGLLRLQEQLTVSHSVANAWTPQRGKVC